MSEREGVRCLIAAVFEIKNLHGDEPLLWRDGQRGDFKRIAYAVLGFISITVSCCVND